MSINLEMFRLTKEEKLRLDVYDAIQGLIRERIFYQIGQGTKERFYYYRKQNLKVIHQSYRSLLRLKYRLSEQTIQRMSDDIHSSDFLPMFLDYYFEDTSEEREKIKKIFNHLDLDQLNRDTFSLVISHLKRKGCWQKAKGFASETII